MAEPDDGSEPAGDLPVSPKLRPGAAEMAAYLRNHPDFLTEHSDLLPILTPPSYRDGNDDTVLDFQRFLVQRLQAEVARLKLQQRRLISTTRLNLNSQQRVHAATLAINGAPDFATLIQVVTTDLALALDIDVATLCVESAGGGVAAPPGIHLLPPGSVERLLKGGREARLQPDVTRDPAVHGSGTGLVRSEALLRLTVPKAPPGILALGSRRVTAFQPGYGTEFLSYLAKSLSVALARWLDL